MSPVPLLALLLPAVAAFADVSVAPVRSRPRARHTARRVAERDPCALLSAIYDLPTSHDAKAKPSNLEWSVSLQAECCKDPRIEPRPAVMSLDDTLIGWGHSCGGRLGGPQRRASSIVDFYYIYLDVKDRTTLRFDITPGRVVFDRAGRTKQSVIQGCSSFRGEARLEERGAAARAN